MRLAYSTYYPFGEMDRTFPPIIMLHGITNSRQTWDRLAPKMAGRTGRMVYTLDCRNHGESPWSVAFDYEFMTKDLEEFMTTHDISKAILVGHSMGGRIAMTLALKKPEKVEKIVVEDMTTGNGPEEMSKYFLQYIAFLRHAIDFITPKLDELTFKECLVQIIEQMTPLEMRTAGDVNLASKVLNIPLKATAEGGFAWSANLEVIEKAAKESQLRQHLEGQYDGESLFLYGDKSFMKVNEDKEDIKGHFPQARFIGFEGAGHNIHTYRESGFIDAIVDFIS